MRSATTLLMLAAVGATVSLAAPQARADYYGYGSVSYGGYASSSYYVPRCPPVYVPPRCPPVYYAPAPVVYSPPPVVYASPPVVYSAPVYHRTAYVRHAAPVYHRPAPVVAHYGGYGYSGSSFGFSAGYARHHGHKHVGVSFGYRR